MIKQIVTHHFSGFAFAIDLAKAGPLAELLVVVDLDQVDLMFGAQSLHQFDVPKRRRVKRYFYALSSNRLSLSFEH